MQTYTPTYDAMMHGGGMSATPHDNALPFSTQPTASSPLGGPSFTSADIDMKPFAPTFSTFDQPTTNTGNGRSSGAAAGFGGETGPAGPSSASALASGQRTPMSSYGGDSNSAAAQWSFHAGNSYGQPLQQQQSQQHPLHTNHHSQQPQNQAGYTGQHWNTNTTFYDA
jgi:hypothetical protein